MGKAVVKELIQSDLNTSNLTRELEKLLNEKFRNKILQDYEALEQKLGGAGASENTARLIIERIQH
jgi:lipid-A-disaccharide synthase